MTPRAMNRSLVIDGAKLLGCLVIMLHHLTLYGPMAEWIAEAWPKTIQFIRENGRYAVQPFLVIGGYLATHSMVSSAHRSLPHMIWQRYLRLAPQLVMALLLVVLVTWAVGDALATAEWLSPLPDPGVFLAHVFFMQDILGIDAISAGVWYVGIDFQLFIALSLLGWVCVARGIRLEQSNAAPCMAAMTLASIFYFNKAPALDIWAIYYWGAYGLGALVALSSLNAGNKKWLWLALASTVASWAMEPSVRPVLCLATVALLCMCCGRAWDVRQYPVIETLSKHAYGIFVCHFAVIILVSGLWQTANIQGLEMAMIAFITVVLLSIAIGAGIQVLSDLIIRASTWHRKI